MSSSFVCHQLLQEIPYAVRHLASRQKTPFVKWQRDVLFTTRRANLVVGRLEGLKDIGAAGKSVDGDHQGMIIA
jgi:hypothetical protein